MTESKAVVLIVDDEDDIRRNIVRTLGAQEYTFLEAQGDIELRHVLVQTAVDLIILDLNMPDFQDKFFSFSGLESLRFVQENYSHIPVIVFSAMSPHHRRDAYRLGAYGVVEKDGTLESIKELRQRVREALYEKKTMTLATPSPSSNKLWQLAQRIMEAFNIEELKGLCLKIGINYEMLEGATLAAKAQALVTYAQRHQQMSALVQACKELRPNVSWPTA